MTPDELKKERLTRGMTYSEFGEWIAERISAAAPDQKTTRAYPRQRVYDWEHNVVPVPAKVEAALLREEVARLKRVLEHERGPAAGHEPHEEQISRKELLQKLREFEEIIEGKGRSKSRGADASDW